MYQGSFKKEITQPSIVLPAEIIDPQSEHQQEQEPAIAQTEHQQEQEPAIAQSNLMTALDEDNMLRETGES